MLKFPKNIYQVWFQGCSNITNERFTQNIKNWKLLNSDWKYHCLNDTDLKKLCNQYSPECGKAYSMAQVMHAKIDLGKLVAVYLNGGIMIDMDMYVLRSLSSSSEVNKIIDIYEKTGEPVIGLSQLNLSYLESLISGHYTTFFNNAVIMSSPKNPYLKKYIDTIILNIYNNQNKDISNFNYINKTTGPINLNKYINTNQQEKNIIIFDSAIFEPCNAGHQCDISNDTIALHNPELSWTPTYIKKFAKLYYNKNIQHFLCSTLLIGLIYLTYTRNK